MINIITWIIIPIFSGHCWRCLEGYNVIQEYIRTVNFSRIGFYNKLNVSSYTGADKSRFPLFTVISRSPSNDHSL